MVDLSTPIPPSDLVLLVNGHENRELFATSRRPAVEAILGMLAEVGLGISDFGSILDFGCGCGRILAGWERLLRPDAQLFGCDINERLVEFCVEHVRHAIVHQSSFMPPLSYRDEQFDLIYAISVYTHMTLPAMLQWTGEFARIIKPGGVVLVSTSGSRYAKALADLSKEGSRALLERGYYVHVHGTVQGTFRGSNNYATFTTSGFMKRIFCGFELIAVFPGISHGPNHAVSEQDVYLFRRLAGY